MGIESSIKAMEAMEATMTGQVEAEVGRLVEATTAARTATKAARSGTATLATMTEGMRRAKMRARSPRARARKRTRAPAMRRRRTMALTRSRRRRTAS